MIILNKTICHLFRLAMAIASMLGLAWTLALIAAGQVSTLEALFLLHGSALAAAVFTLLWAEAHVEWPLSIIRAAGRQAQRTRSGGLFFRRAEA